MLSTNKTAHTISWKTGKYAMILYGSELSDTYQGGDHYCETEQIVTHFEGLGAIYTGQRRATILFKFWAPCSRLSRKDQGLDRAIFGFEEHQHYHELALDMVPASRHEDVLEWVMRRIVAECRRKKSGDQTHLGCIPHDEFVNTFCSEPATS